MSTDRTVDYEEILTIVRSWPAAERFTLVQDVLMTLAPAEAPNPRPQATLDQARGLLATERPAQRSQS